MWDGASAGTLAPGGKLVTITGDSQGAVGVLELLKRGYQTVSRKLYCLFVIGRFASYHQVDPGYLNEHLPFSHALIPRLR